MKNLSLGLKITSGFALLILVAAALGAVAIWNMNAVETQSKMLAHEYVPEVDVAEELRGASNRVMYEMRGYGFTEEARFYDNAQLELKAVDAALEKARQLEAKSANLKRLKGQLEIATQAVETYKTLVEKTVETNAKLAQTRKILDESALKYMTNCNDFLAGQNEKFKEDLNERQNKITFVSRLVDTGSKTRVLNFKSQALGDPALMEEAISTISVAGDILNDLRKITTGKDDFRRIDNIEQAAGNYKNDMQGFLKEYQKKNLADAAVLNGFRADMDENAAIYPHAIIIKADKSIIRDTA